jgi:hypothetical protein
MPLFWIFALALATGACAADRPRPHPRPQLATADGIRIDEAFRLADNLGDSLWPGMAGTPMPVLLVTDSAEFLFRHDHPGVTFVLAGRDPLNSSLMWTRSRRLLPTLVATFPVDGVPTIVVGTSERTGKTSTAWVLTLLHEHFHQWQYGQPGYYDDVGRLDLSGGDTTGIWMLDYPFPYDSAPVGQAVRRWAVALRSALNAGPLRSQRLKEIVNARNALRRLLSAADYRYLEFQLWQEGVARYVEYRTAELASRQEEPDSNFRKLPDYQPYSAVAVNGRRDLLSELERTDLETNRRVSFYAIGAAIALLLDKTRPGWKQAYSEHPFSLAPLLDASLKTTPLRQAGEQ